MIFIYLLVLVIIVGIIVGAKTEIKYFTFETKKISKDIRIVQLSDIHSIKKQHIYDKLTKKVNNLNPQIVVFTGDIITLQDDKLTLNFISSLKGEKYYISGNHEFDYGQKFYEQLVRDLQNIGVYVLDDSSVTYKNEINIMGLKDYSEVFLKSNTSDKEVINKINSLVKENIKPNMYNIFLMHRPHYFKNVSNNNIELFLSGHVHGGQWRLFNIFAAIGPDQGLFPKYFQGKYIDNNSVLLVSPGLERKYKIPRIYNPRAVYVIDLKLS